MTRVSRLACLCVVGGMTLFVGSSFSKDLRPISCSPDRPVVRPGEVITFRVWADPGQQETLTYEWEISTGKLRGTGSEASWDFTGVKPGSYSATAFTAYSTGETEKCTIQVLVEQPEARGGITGWSLLLSGTKEKSGYGLYSYILFGSRPTDATRERYLKTLEAYVSLVESIASLEASGIAKHRLNITYVPVIKIPPPKERPSPEWLLNNYNYAGARAILSALPGVYRSDGPYIVSQLKPINATQQIKDKYLYQDLSIIMPRVVFGYAREFLNQAAQERYWEESTTRQLALKLQNTMYLMARALPDVTEAMKKVKDIKSTITWKD
jgi:hypothetical protein